MNGAGEIAVLAAAVALVLALRTLRGEARGVRPAPAVVALLVRLLGRSPAPPGSGGLLAAAAAPAWLRAPELIAIKLAAAAAAALPGLVLARLAPGRAAILVAAALPAAGFMLPDALLRRRARARAAGAARELATVAELLRAATGAGVPLQRAIATVGARGGGPLSAELALVARGAALGASLDDCLGRLAGRLPVPAVGALASSLRRSQRLGTPLAASLAAIADDARAAEARRIRERAARAGPKIQLVIALMLVPSVMLLIAAALLRPLLHR